MANIIKSAFDVYNNHIKDVDSQNLSLNSLASKLTENITAFTNAQISKLNSLLSKIPNFNLGKKSDSVIVNSLNNLLNEQMNKIKASITDTTRDLINTGISFATNITDEFLKDLASRIFIPDQIFVETIKVLNNAGGDIGYNNHYLRRKAIANDWYHTFDYINKQYKISYTLEYRLLESELKIITANSCHKILYSVFTEMYEDYNNRISLIAFKKEELSFEELKTVPDGKVVNDLNLIISKLEDDILTYRKLFLTYMKRLILYSHDYFKTSDCKRFYDTFGSVLLPKYYGETDDEFENAFVFTEHEVNIMLPFFIGHDVNTDVQKTIDNSSRTSLIEDIENLSSEDKAYADALTEIANKEFNSNAKIGAATDFFDSRASYKNNSSGSNSSKFEMQYKGKPIISIDKNKYTVPRNLYIKEIYVYLSSVDFFQNDRMVNFEFYTRCKYSYMSTVRSEIDQALSNITSGSLVQNTLKNIDTYESMIYEYTKGVEQFLLDPKVNKDDSFENVGKEMVDGYDIGEFNSSTENLLPTNTTSDPSLTINETTSSTLAVAEADKTNNSKREFTYDILRYVNNISMVDRATILKKYMRQFYDYCINILKISEDVLNNSYETMNFGIFNVSNMYTPDDITSILTNVSNERLSDYIIAYISTSVYGKTTEIFKWDLTDSDISKISKAFDTFMFFMSYDIYIYGYARTVYLYENEKMESLTKQFFQNSVALCKTINNSTVEENPLKKIFFNLKDVITYNFYGYDHNGIIAVNRSNKFEQLNLTIGDYNVIKRTVDGLFFLSNASFNKGIFYLSENNEIITTNITNGSWIKIEEINSFTFFTNSKNELYVWDKNKKEITFTNIDQSSLTDGGKVYISNTNGNYMFLVGDTGDDGIKIFNKNTLRYDDTNVTSGNSWVMSDLVRSGLLFYSTTTNGLHKFNAGAFTTINNSTKFTSIFEYTEHVITTVEIPVDPSTITDETTPTVITQSMETDYYYAALGTMDSGIKVLDISTNTILDSIIKTNYHNLFEISNVYYSISNGKVYKVNLSLDNQNTSLAANTVENLTIVSGQDNNYTEIELLTSVRVGRIIQYNRYTDTEITDRRLYILDNNGIIKRITNITNAEIKGGLTFKENYDKYHVFISGSAIKNFKVLFEDYYALLVPSYNNSNTHEILNNKNWNFLFTINDTYITNYSDDLDIGVKVLDINSTSCKLVDTSIKSGKKWIINYSPNGLIAISSDGMNLGIMLQKDRTTFSYDTEGKYKYGDFKPFYYDSVTKLSFIGADRSKLQFSFDIMDKYNPYNIDYFLIYKNPLDLQDKIVDLLLGLSNTVIEKMFVGEDDGLSVEDGLSITDSVNSTLSNFTNSCITIEKNNTNYHLINSNVSVGSNGSVLIGNNGYIDGSILFNANGIEDKDFDVDDTNAINAILKSLILSSSSSDPNILRLIESINKPYYQLFNIYKFNEDGTEVPLVDSLSENSVDPSINYFKPE